MHLLDWILVVIPLLLVVASGVYVQAKVRSVADFMSANRSAGRYLLCVAGGELQSGAVVFVASFEIFAHGGFSVIWWSALATMATYLVRVSGFVTYRYRETRAMTLGQFFEIRYNKSFRLFTGLLGFLSGILNFGIIPGIGARALVYFLGLPETLRLASMTVPTYVPLMALFLFITLFVALSGGAITVMVINALEGMISQVFYLVIIAALLALFSWSQMRGFLLSQPPGESLVNPFDTGRTQDFNIWYVLMGVATGLYGTMAWQNSSAYNSAGLTPHEGRMANVLTSWREMGKNAVITLLALCALTYLHDAAFAPGAARVHQAVAQIADPQAREQMRLPIAVSCLLPLGLKGIFCVILLMGVFGGDATHLHSWGGIFVQDFLVPLRRKPFGARAHLFALRCSIAGVALFAFLFGTFFHMNDYIIMWWSVTTAVFVGGAGSAIIGGLYWKRGTSAGAWAAFVTGSLLSGGGIILQQVEAAAGRSFFLNGVQIGFFACLVAMTVYVVTSLLTYRSDFDLDRMLHRRADDAGAPAIERRATPWWADWGRWIGMDENFTRADKWVAGSLFAWTFFWLGVFVVGTVWNLIAPWTTTAWLEYDYIVGVIFPIVFAVITGLWFTWGAGRDMLRLVRGLDRERVNLLDDGTVVNHQNLDEAVSK